MSKLVKIVACITVSICVTAFWVTAENTSAPPASTHIAPDSAARSCQTVFNDKIIDSARSLLKTGDIVLRRGIGADSYLLAMMNRKDKTFSHCGIVVIENDTPYVYHSIGGEDNPDERLRQDPLTIFFSPLHNTEIAIVRYDLSQNQVKSLTDIVHEYYRLRPKFDLKFSLASDDQLYCSEFVYKAVNKATADTAYIGTSSLSGGRFVAIDNLFINPHAHIIWQTKFKQYLYSQK